uniref:Kisspeptin 1 n=1 Tax=Steinernema glaseri TaxID=37863 RepID=A0A1I7ZGY8_9BILA
MRRAPVVTDQSPQTARSQHDRRRMSPRASTPPLLLSVVVVFALQAAVDALSVQDLCRQADSAALCRALQRAPPSLQEADRPDRDHKPDDSEPPAPLRLAFWRYTRLHPRNDPTVAAAASSFSKNGGKRGYDFIRFGRSANAPLKSYDFIRLGK